MSYTSETPRCLRRIDTDVHYPEDLSETSVHRNGLIWSAALWDIRNAIGRVQADTTILQAHFAMGEVTDMPYAAAKIVETAEDLYGAGTASEILAAFEARGIL